MPKTALPSDLKRPAMTNQEKQVAPQRPLELIEEERTAARSALIRWFAEMIVKDYMTENHHDEVPAGLEKHRLAPIQTDRPDALKQKIRPIRR